MIEYWKNSREAKDGTVDLEQPYEDWASDYAEELTRICISEDAAKRSVRAAISEYFDMIGGKNDGQF